MIQDKTRGYVVVFDIDDALCRVSESVQQLALAKKYDPECPIIKYIHKGDTFKGEYIHVFVPYLNILKELENTAKIALQGVQSQVDIKKSAERYISIVGVGIAFSAKSLIAAYTSYERCRKVHLTDIYTL